MQKLLTFFFSAKILVYYAIFNDQSFNDMLTSGIISFEQLGPDKYFSHFSMKTNVTGTIYYLSIWTLNYLPYLS